MPEPAPPELPATEAATLPPHGNAIPIEFRPHDEAAREQYRGVWHKPAQAVQKHHQLAAGLPRS